MTAIIFILSFAIGMVCLVNFLFNVGSRSMDKQHAKRVEEFMKRHKKVDSGKEFVSFTDALRDWEQDAPKTEHPDSNRK